MTYFVHTFETLLLKLNLFFNLLNTVQKAADQLMLWPPLKVELHSGILIELKVTIHVRSSIWRSK